MRALPARRLAVPALCATLLLGVTAPAALATDAETARDHARSASAPVPGADALLAQLKGLGDLGGVLKPVTDLLDAALKADNGQLSAEQVAELGKAVRDAIDKAKAAAPATPPAALPADPAAPALPVTPAEPAVPSAPATPSAPAVPPEPPAVTTPTVPAAPAVPAAPSVPAAPQLPVTLPAYDRGPAQPVGRLAASPVTDALTVLQTAVDALLKAVTSGDLAQVLPTVTGVVAALVKVIAAILVGSGLPVPADLPAVQPPVQPSTELPATPPTGTLPVR